MPKHPDYRAHWAAAGYELPMGSEEVCLPPPRDFVRVYHLTSAEHALTAIALGRLKVARISELNDPFEFLALNLKGEHRRKVMRDNKAALDRTHGILCFSRDWMNPVLWSHYGDRHRGICLGFNLRRSRAEVINYDVERVRQELDGDRSSLRLTKDQQLLLRRTKFAHWDYEGEQRLFVELGQSTQEGSLFFWNFDEDLVLAEVVLGPDCHLPLDRVRGFVDALYANAVTFKGRPGVKRFEVVRNEATVP